VIRGIQKLADDVTKREQDFAQSGETSTALRYFPGRGKSGVGRRAVITSDAAWKIHQRAAAVHLCRAVDRSPATQWGRVRARTTEPLWARVRQTIENFLNHGLAAAARCRAARPSEAFFVKCDRSTMSQGRHR